MKIIGLSDCPSASRMFKGRIYKKPPMNVDANKNQPVSSEDVPQQTNP
jgi:hypothetical protein